MSKFNETCEVIKEGLSDIVLVMLYILYIPVILCLFVGLFAGTFVWVKLVFFT